jgi:DNA-binding NarL/FixJ family response regulator
MTRGSESHSANGAAPTNVLATPNLLIVDRSWRAIIASATDIWNIAGIHVRIGHTVPVALQTVASSACDAANVDRSAAYCVRIALCPDIAMTIYPVETTSERLMALSVQQFRARKDLRHAQVAYGLSPRELDILRHVLDGSGTPQIALALNIADSTVIAHVKSLLMKTKAANRAALVARVLGW